jgi:large subunit ribosomal protein L3
MIGILGKKVGMTRFFSDNGDSFPVTLIECEANKVVTHKAENKAGYNAVVLGVCELKGKRKNTRHKLTKEFKVESLDEFKDSASFDLSHMTEAKEVKVSAISKGKGFQGTIKRFNFSRGPETHGSHHHREPGSVGACAKPGRIHKGKKLPGRMGAEQVTLSKVKVVQVDTEANTIALKGCLPGANGSFLRIEIQS